MLLLIYTVYFENIYTTLKTGQVFQSTRFSLFLVLWKLIFIPGNLRLNSIIRAVLKLWTVIWKPLYICKVARTTLTTIMTHIYKLSRGKINFTFDKLSDHWIFNYVYLPYQESPQEIKPSHHCTEGFYQEDTVSEQSRCTPGLGKCKTALRFHYLKKKQQQHLLAV